MKWAGQWRTQLRLEQTNASTTGKFTPEGCTRGQTSSNSYNMMQIQHKRDKSVTGWEQKHGQTSYRNEAESQLVVVRRRLCVRSGVIGAEGNKATLRLRDRQTWSVAHSPCEERGGAQWSESLILWAKTYGGEYHIFAIFHKCIIILRLLFHTNILPICLHKY